MIVDSMSYEEIANAIRKDFVTELQNGYNSCFGQKEKYEMYIMKHLSSNKFHYFGSKEKLTRGQNKYVFHFITYGKKSFMGNGVIRIFWLEYFRNDGKHIVKINPHNLDEITFFTPHFFDRYEERYLNNNSVMTNGRNNTILEYFLNNEASAGGLQDNPKYPGSMFLCTNEGVVLGVDLGNSMWEYRTFISYDMLKGNQIELADYPSSTVEQIKELMRSGKLNIAKSSVTGNYDV